jgi:23S rRNA maturation mini-RNase III
MDDEDIRHWQHLIIEHQRYLRILEEKVVNFGKLNAPAHILKEIEDTKRSITELEQRIRRRIRNAVTVH